MTPFLIPANGLRRVVLLDTAVASTNLGDQIIMEAVRRELGELFADAIMLSVASHEWMGRKSRGMVRRSELAIAGGTNLISSRMWLRSPWKVSPIDALLVDNVVLMGCGWYQFQKAPDWYSAWILRRVLSRRFTHSVRDSYTLGRLKELGVGDAINTGCPTLWRFDAAVSARVPKAKASAVIATVNTYMPDRDADARLLATLRRLYDPVYVWVQTAEDLEYARGLDPRVVFVAPSLAAYDDFLGSDIAVDYVGNRLHAGIRALQAGRRTIIVEIDNRAREMGRDFGLPTVERTAFDRLEKMIQEPFAVDIRPPVEAIAAWKAQFHKVKAER